MKKLLSILVVSSMITAINLSVKAAEFVIVDMQRILDEASAAKDVRDKIKKQRDQYQSQITKQEESLRKDEKKLSQQKSILSQEAFEKKGEEFKKKLIDVQRDVQEKRANLDKSLNKALGQIQESVLSIITNLSKEKGFKIALPSSQVLFATDENNITKDVLDRLNKNLPKVSIKK